MALPPEPLEAVLPAATWIVEAEVAAVLGTGAAPPRPPGPPMPSSPTDSPAQRLKLNIRRVLRGDASAKELVAVKPAAGYALRVGARGIFLLDGTRPEPAVLGRYGPDTYLSADIEAALDRGVPA
jgi:hypothetical protein